MRQGEFGAERLQQEKCLFSENISLKIRMTQKVMLALLNIDMLEHSDAQNINTFINRYTTDKFLNKI